MPRHSGKSIVEIAAEVGRYSLDAYRFLQDGLDYTVQKEHGVIPSVFKALLRQLEREGVELSDFIQSITEGSGSPQVLAFLKQPGGLEAAKLLVNRHVSGDELCWGLHDLAIERWGLMASTVLAYWGIRSTKDFGNMVFALVDHGVLGKLPEDRIEDFADVYDFAEAFDGTYKVSASRKKRTEGVAE